jgi:hypothetical protein
MCVDDDFQLKAMQWRPADQVVFACGIAAEIFSSLFLVGSF